MSYSPRPNCLKRASVLTRRYRHRSPSKQCRVVSRRYDRPSRAPDLGTSRSSLATLTTTPKPNHRSTIDTGKHHNHKPRIRYTQHSTEALPTHHQYKRRKGATQATTVAMSLHPIRPFADERVQHKTAVLNGHTYHYLYATPPSGGWSDTVFLVCLNLHLPFTVLPIFPPGPLRYAITLCRRQHKHSPLSLSIVMATRS